MSSSAHRGGWFYLAAIWVRLLVVSAGAWVLYAELGGLLWNSLLDLPWMDRVARELEASWLESLILVLGGVLVWWRLVKVFVLHGAPLPLGIAISDGRQNEGRSGRPVTRLHIGDLDVHRGNYKGKFWYGAVFRAHPSSDKIMRSRLELLVLALPFGLSLSVHESRLFVRRSGHEYRANQYRLVFDKYSLTRGSTTPDHYRTEVVRQLRSIGGYFDRRKNVKRIDGLDWHFMMGGEGLIMDDFGCQISFERTDDGTYKVTQLGPEADQEAIVDTMEQIRSIARKELAPNTVGDG